MADDTPEKQQTTIPVKTIQLHGYNIRIEASFEEEKKSEEESLRVQISYVNKITTREFFDEFYVSHKSRDFLLSVVQTLYATFGPEAIRNGFIHHNEQIGSFEYQYIASQTPILTVMRTCGLSRLQYTRKQAIDEVKRVNEELSKQCDSLYVECVNAHIIHDSNWELEITLNLKPGLYHFHVPDLLSVSTEIRVRNYLRIRDFYMTKLKDFYAEFKIFRVYLDHIKAQRNKWIWTNLGFEAGPMDSLYTILQGIKDDDPIWSDLFNLCLLDGYQTNTGKEIALNSNIDNKTANKSSADIITEHSVANFIALSIKYYCYDRKKGATKLLTACDKFLLSIVLPYFNISGVKIETLKMKAISGLFNQFVDFYKDKKYNNLDWKMTIDGSALKNELLLRLNRAQINVVKKRWYYTKTKQETDDCELSYTLIERNVFLNNNQDIINQSFAHLDVYDTTHVYQWAMWTNKNLKRYYPTSKGYWRLLDDNILHPRVPIYHLEALQSLFASCETYNKAAAIHMHDTANNETAHYIINAFKSNKNGATTIRIRIRKAKDATIDKKKKLKSRDSFFLHYAPFGDPLSSLGHHNHIEWMWYNNDRSCYEAYTLGENVVKQIEASYQAVQEDNFPIAEYNRSDHDDNDDKRPLERLFNDPSLTETQVALAALLGRKSFILRFTYHEATNQSSVKHMEQVAINHDDNSKFPRSMQRFHINNNNNDNNNGADLDIDDVDADHRLFCLGQMTIHMHKECVEMHWIFSKNDKMHIAKTQEFVCKIDMALYNKNRYTEEVKIALEKWRCNALFNHLQFSIELRADLEINVQKCNLKKTKHKREIYNEIYTEIAENQERDNNNNNLPVDYDGIMSCGLLKVVDDEMWRALDALDDGLEEKYEDDERISEIYKKCHKKELFNKNLFTLMSLYRVQSIISVFAEQIKEEEKMTKDVLILALSNEQLLFDSKHAKNVQSTDGDKSLSCLFDAASFMKRIDSKQTIYDINIEAFDANIVDRDYLHDFMRLASAAYKSTLFLFTRRGSNNIYVSHNGLLRKLGLEIYNEDLHYFLPTFVCFQIGDFIDIECFSYPDCGTIIDRFRKKEEEEESIYYHIRSSHNVFYTLNYYQVTNRHSMNNYFKKCRDALMDKRGDFARISLWNREDERRNVTDASHPMHIFSLSLVESSKQAIAAINVECGENKERMREIEDKLTQSGVMYLLYRTVKNVENERENERIQDLIAEQKNNKKNKKNANANKIYIDANVLYQYEKSGESQSRDNDLNLKLLQHLESEKFLFCKKQINKKMTYENLNANHVDIFNNKNNEKKCNKLYIIHIREERKLVLVNDDNDNDLAANNNINDDLAAAAKYGYIDSVIEAEEDNDNYAYESDDSDDWATYEVDDKEEEAVVVDQESAIAPQHIEIESRFESMIECEYFMSNVYPQTKTVEDLLIKHRNNDDDDDDDDKKQASIKWTIDENRLLTFFRRNLVYNEYDLNDWQIVTRLKRKLASKTAEPHYWKLYKKFEEFMKRIKKSEDREISTSGVNIIAGVQMTRNAVLLQREYIKTAMDAIYNNDEEEERFATMVITYNPLQSVIISSCTAKDITHPIHIYRSCYASDLSNFYNNYGLNKLYTLWMTKPIFHPLVHRVYKKNKSQVPNANIIDTLSLLIRYNKKYEIVIVPSSVSIADVFLSAKCKKVAPELDAIAESRCTFIYKGMLYQWLKKEEEEEEVIEEEEKKEEEEEDKKEAPFFLDDLKKLIRKIKENIVENAADCMDPQPLKETEIIRIRSRIKRNNRDIMLRWIKIGCGSCFLHEPNGRQTEIGPPESGDYDNDFPKLLKQAMFIYYVDCKIPYDFGAILNDENQCNLCLNYIVEAARVENCCIKKHEFCYKCLKLWREHIDNPEIGTLRDDWEKKNKITLNAIRDTNVLNEILLPQNCPNYFECHEKIAGIEKISSKPKIVQKHNIPMTVYQQLVEENETRYMRLDVLNKYQQHREMLLAKEQAEQSKLSLEELRKQYPKIDLILSGY